MAAQVPPLMQEASSQIPLLHSPKQSAGHKARSPSADPSTVESPPPPPRVCCPLAQRTSSQQRGTCSSSLSLMLVRPPEELKAFSNMRDTINQRTHFITTEGDDGTVPAFNPSLCCSRKWHEQQPRPIPRVFMLKASSLCDRN